MCAERAGNVNFPGINKFAIYGKISCLFLKELPFPY